MSDDAGPELDEADVDAVLAEVDELIADRRRYRAALVAIAGVLEPALDSVKLGTPTYRAIRAALERARLELERDGQS